MTTLIGALLLAACVDTAGDSERIVVATTTSVEDSGLLDVLIPAFEVANPGYSVQYMAVGSGQALELGRRGDVDVLITHSPADEQQFMDDGHGSERRALMQNEFLLLGPPGDPAGIRGSNDVAAAFGTIAATRSAFISRADNSGTHRREASIWSQAGIQPAGDWYIEAGVGMGDVLRIASERQAYTLSDMGTYAIARNQLELIVVSSGDSQLVNAYSVITVAGAVLPAAAARFSHWLTSPPAQALIAGFGVDQVGQPLFVPAVRTVAH